MPKPNTEALRELLNVSQLEVKTEGDETVTAIVTKADGQKCERCWHWETDVGITPEHPTICARCVTAVKGKRPQGVTHSIPNSSHTVIPGMAFLFVRARKNSPPRLSKLAAPSTLLLKNAVIPLLCRRLLYHSRPKKLLAQRSQLTVIRGPGFPRYTGRRSPLRRGDDGCRHHV